MVYRIAGGLFLLFYGLAALGVVSLPEPFMGVLALIAGIGLLGGF